MYDNLMNKFKFGGISNPDIYLDETVLRMCYTHRRIFAQLGMQLVREGKKEQARNLLLKAEKEIPAVTVRHNWHGGSPEIARTWLALGQKQKAKEILDQLGQNASEYLDWYMNLPLRYVKISASDIRYYFYQLQEVQELMSTVDPKKAEQYGKAIERYYGAMAYTNNYRSYSPRRGTCNESAF
jgi:tetratricopeptide (TPR) repeat protein